MHLSGHTNWYVVMCLIPIPVTFLKRLLASLLLLPLTAWAQPARHKMTDQKLTADAAIAAEIRAETGRSWQAYRRYAWQHDELKPLTKTYHDWYQQPIAIAPIDGYPTLKLMGFNEAAEEIEHFVVDSLRFDRDQYVKTYEVYQRILGGLLCMYQYTHNEHVLQKAEEFGQRLLPAFRSKTGIPYFYVNLKTGQAKGDTVNVAEGGSYVLEMGILSYYTYAQVNMYTGQRMNRFINVWDAYFPALLALSGDVKRAAKHQNAWDKLWDRFGMLPERYNYETSQVVDPPYTLNPEIMESAYYLYHYTGDPKYKKRMLKYYRDIVRHCRTDVAYTVIADVRTKAKGDALETFFIAETMKYMYLPFWGENQFRFDDYVFTTEAHPFRKAQFTRTESKKRLGF